MKRVRLAALIIIAVAIILTGLWWLARSTSPFSSADVETSGFIEAKDVAIAFETSGRIVEIAGEEGDQIKAGATIARLDDSLLKAQKRQAEVNLLLAQAYLEQATVSGAGAKKAREDALDVQNNPLELDTRIIAAQGQLETAELDLKRVRDIQTKFLIATAQISQDTAQKVLDNLANFETLGLVGLYEMNKQIYPAEGELDKAKLNLLYQQQLATLYSLPVAQATRDNAQKAFGNLLAIKNNPQTIKSAVDQAETAFQVATATVKVAGIQVEQAKSALELINVQLDKLTVASPVAGVVAAKTAEVGEIAKPGAAILTITDLNSMTLTAYVPESKIGLVKLGQKAMVSIDSYPGESFSGEVVFISPEAQFTPRNVQLKEEREKTVFAVKIRLDNPQQKLKPGMPADARILTSSPK